MAHDGTLENDVLSRDERHLTVVEPEGRLTQRQIEKFLQDLTWEQNDWRYVADREADYYDSKQLDAEILQLMEDRGMPPLVRNIIGPTIDGILGMEEQSRRDLKVVGVDDDEQSAETADALNVKFNEAQRIGEFDQACGDVYKPQVMVGIGWMGISRPLDPFEGQYRCEAIHRREMFWDWRAQKRDLSDARYLIRKKWYDKDILKTVFPDKAAVIDNAVDLWANWDWEAITGGSPYHSAPLSTAYSQFTSTALEMFEWLDTDRERAALYEVWYRVFERSQVLRTQSNRVVEFDPKNPVHQKAAETGAARVEPTVLSKVRLAYWLGPHQILDIPTPYPHNRFPYVPFWGMREDRTGIPYGMVRRMMSPQDEVNARLSKMMWLLSAKRIEGDSDAFDMDHEELLEEASRGDSLILFNPDRANPQDKPVIKTEHQLAKDQFSVMQDAEIYVQQKAAGTFAAFQGQDNEAQSGRAFERLIEQSATSLADINGNYAYGRRKAGEILLSLVKQDVLEGEAISVVRKGQRTTVTLNAENYDEQGNPYRRNHVEHIRTRVELEEVPKTAAYRQKQYDQLAEIIKSLPENAQMAVLDLLFKVSDLPDRQEIIDRLNKMGIGESPDGEQDPAVAQQKAMEQRVRQLELRDMESQIAEREAKTAHENAKLDETLVKIKKLLAEVRETGADTAKTEAEIDKIAAEIGGMTVDTAMRVEDNRREDERSERERQGQEFDQEQRQKEANAST